MEDFNETADFINFVAGHPLAKVRNFVIDWHEDSVSMHGAIQIMDSMHCNDDEIVDVILKRAGSRKKDIYSIIEVMGRHTLEEVDRMLDDQGRTTKAVMRSIYLDKAQALI